MFAYTMNEKLNTLIFNLMGGGGHLKEVPANKALQCLDFYWKRRGRLKVEHLPIADRRISVLLLYHSWNLSVVDLQRYFNVSRSTIIRDINYMEWFIMRNKATQDKYHSMYSYIVYYCRLYYI